MLEDCLIIVRHLQTKYKMAVVKALSSGAGALALESQKIGRDARLARPRSDVLVEPEDIFGVVLGL